MACLRIFLTWALGFPLALTAFGAVIGAVLYGCELAARHLGWAEGAGCIAGVALIIIAMGATFGLIECRDRC